MITAILEYIGNVHDPFCDTYPEKRQITVFCGHINTSQPILYLFPHPDLRQNGDTLISIIYTYYFAHNTLRNHFRVNF